MPRDRFERRHRLRERRKVFVIATEGQETEAIYFESFKGDRFRKNIRIAVLPSKKGKSSPDAVRKRLQAYEQKYGIEDGDELWVVVDVDQWGEQALDELCRLCFNHGYNVAVSNPCFEYWLLLHQENPPSPSTVQGCEKALERRLGSYHKVKYDVDKLIPDVRQAIAHARRRDNNPDEPWPREPGTHVYKLVEKLIVEPD